jgi:hypothetical protein
MQRPVRVDFPKRVSAFPRFGKSTEQGALRNA